MFAMSGTTVYGYNLTNSLRVRSDAGAYLNRTPASSGSQSRWTWSGWIKRGKLGSTQTIFSAYSASDYQTYINFTSSDTLQFYNVWGGATSTQNLITTQVFRDCSSWYHIVIAVNLNASNMSDAVQISVNGVRVTSFGTSSFTNAFQAGAINGAFAHAIGQYATQNTNYFDGYLTEINFINGQQLTAPYFGSIGVNGIWQPIAYTGSYSTNGFYLPFTDNSALTTSSNVGLGKDFSGNGNYWTTNNISITSGVTYDSMTDVPTLTSSTQSNFCVLNPLSGTTGSLYNCNLYYAGPGAYGSRMGTMSLPTSGKTYFEVTIMSAPYTPRGASTAYNWVGVCFSTNFNVSGSPNSSNVNGVMLGDNGFLNNFGATSSDTGYAISSGNIIGVAIDTGANTYTFYRNNSVIATGTMSVTAGTSLSPLHISYDASYGGMQMNFGQRPFTYTPPTGFKALTTFNLPIPTIKVGNKYMDATLYTGNGSTQSVVNASGFQSDFIWIKSRSSTGNSSLTDSVRGVNSQLFSNLTDAAGSQTDQVTAFNSNGFSLGPNSAGTGSTNVNTVTYVGWQWQAGQGTTSSNTSGSITSTVSVNATAGFSVVTWTANGSANQSIGHGLGVAPSVVLVKDRTTVNNWNMWFTGFSANEYLQLNTTIAKGSFSTLWYQVPTSTVFYVGTSGTAANYQNGDQYVAYCWTPIAGYSSFGTYTGNGSTNGPFVYTGFRPRFVLWKNTTSASVWAMLDSARGPFNENKTVIQPQSSGGEGDAANGYDFLSNGFKVRNTDVNWNQNGDVYIYMAFAENPFKYTLAR